MMLVRNGDFYCLQLHSLRKDPEGFIFAEINVPDVPAVPVSKQYYEALSALL